MLPASNTVVGVDFGAPRRARDQRRKIIAIAAHVIADRRYRVEAIGMNERLLAKDPPGWSAKELLDELLTRTVRIVAFDFPFSIPDILLRDEEFAANAGYTHGAFIGWRMFNEFVAERLPLGEPLDFRPFDAWRSRLWSPVGIGFCRSRAGTAPARSSKSTRVRRCVRWVWRITSPDPRKRFDWESPPARLPKPRSTSIHGCGRSAAATTRAERLRTTTLPMRSLHFVRRSSTPKGRAEWRLTAMRP
jgi:hypothetical protein